MSRMHNPPHPGEVIKELCLDPLNLTVTAAAEGLGVSRRTLSTLLNGHAGISPDMAIRLSKAFGRSPASFMKAETGVSRSPTSVIETICGFPAV